MQQHKVTLHFSRKIECNIVGIDKQDCIEQAVRIHTRDGDKLEAFSSEWVWGDNDDQTK